MFGKRKLVWHYVYLILILFIAFLLLAVFLEKRTNTLFIEHNKMLLQESGRTLLNGFDRSYFENEKQARHFADKTAASTSFRLTIILPDGVVIADSNNEPAEMDNHDDRPEILQAAGVIMGANIGTTLTGWLVAILGFKVQIIVIALLAVGVGVPLLFIKNFGRKS